MLSLRKILVSGLFAAAAAVQADYSQHPEAQAFVDKVVEQHGFERDWVLDILSKAERKDSILEAIARPAEKRLEWRDYRKIFITDKRIKQGVEFWKKHRRTLAIAEAEYGVPAEVIVAIIGVETYYGRITGSYRVVDALATLGFDYPKRAKFFSKQLGEYLLMVKEQGFEPMSLKGSYAGAMGYGQFIPSSYRAYAVDFDGDDIADILSNPVDAIGSVANYFAEHKWRKGEPVMYRAEVAKGAKRDWLNDSLKPKHTVAEAAAVGYRIEACDVERDDMTTLVQVQGVDGEEIWLGLHNFYVITRYNHSRLYAMAVNELSQLVAEQYRGH